MFTILHTYKGCAGDSVSHIWFQAPLCGETTRSEQGICNDPPLVNLTVFGHVRFRLRETWIFILHFHYFCNVFLAGFCSGASEKYRKYEKLQWCLKKVCRWGGWDMAERWKHTQKRKFMFISSPSASDKKHGNVTSRIFVTHRNLHSRLRETTGFASATTPPQKSSNLRGGGHCQFQQNRIAPNM